MISGPGARAMRAAAVGILLLLVLAATPVRTASSPAGPETAAGLLATGEIDFAPETRYPVYTGAVTVNVVDLGGDGWEDVMVSGGGGVTAFTGNGDGTFTLPGTVTGVGASLSAVVPGEFNGDGRPDIAVVVPETYDCECICHRKGCACPDGCCQPCCSEVCGPVPGDIRVFLGTGDGTFVQSGDALKAGDAPLDVAVGDFDGDGRRDLAVTSTDRLSVFLGRGDGTFGPEHTARASGSLEALTAGDLNGDGTDDLVAASPATDEVAVLIATGRGGFGDPMRFATGVSPRRPVIVDVDGDGRSDLVVPNLESSDVSVLLGNGDGTFASEKRTAAGPGPAAAALADLNRDGMTDLTVTSRDSNEVWAFPGNGDGSFGTERRFTVGSRPVSLAVGDFDRNGWPDLAVANWLSPSFSILLNQSNLPDCHFVPGICDDGNICTSDSCDPSAGCLHADNSIGCSDGNACSVGDRCSSGVCQGGAPADCDDGNLCTDDACDPVAGCGHVPNSMACDDGEGCTLGDVCSAGACRGTAALRDSDGDGHADGACGGDDCDDANPRLWRPPVEVTGLRLALGDASELTWDDQAALVGSDLIYDLASGQINTVDGFDAFEACLQSGATTGYRDTRPTPEAGLGYWYLVRARNACGLGTYGSPLLDNMIPPCP